MTDEREDIQQLIDELEIPHDETPPTDTRPDLEAWLADKVRLIGYWQGQIADLEATCKKQVQDIKEFYEHKIAQRQRAIDFMQAMIQPTVAKMIEGHKHKSVSTPHGLCGFRTIKPKVNWPEAVVTLEIIKKHDIPAVRSKEAPDLAWMQKHIDFNPNGKAVVTWEDKQVVLDEVDVTPGDQRFYVQPVKRG